MTILLTGGAGYIGIHTAYYLINQGHKVVILDSLVNSHLDSYDVLTLLTDGGSQFFLGDVTDSTSFDTIFGSFDIDSVIHFAGLKSVNESIVDIDDYYNTNVNGTITLLNAMKKHGVNNLIFSSSATVYGDADVYPVTEESELKTPINPYGRTKLMCENLIQDYCDFTDINAVILRYFNPVGALTTGELYENPKKEALNIFPVIRKAINGEGDLQGFGHDYDTPDGTAIRDYIDINDLAEAHVKSLDIIGDEKVEIINLGSGKGYSVMEIINTFSKLNIEIPYNIVERREGDIAEIYADITKAEKVLGWKPSRTLEDSIKTLIKI